MGLWAPVEALSGYLFAANVVSFRLLFLHLLCSAASVVSFHVRAVRRYLLFVRFFSLFLRFVCGP